MLREEAGRLSFLNTFLPPPTAGHFLSLWCGGGGYAVFLVLCVCFQPATLPWQAPKGNASSGDRYRPSSGNVAMASVPLRHRQSAQHPGPFLLFPLLTRILECLADGLYSLKQCGCAPKGQTEGGWLVLASPAGSANAMRKWVNINGE